MSNSARKFSVLSQGTFPGLIHQTFILLPKLLLIPVLAGICVLAYTAPGNVDLSFDPGADLDEGVGTILVQADGKILIAGGFSTVKGAVRKSIARLHADDTLDSSFNAGETSRFPQWPAIIHSLAEQPDGKILIGGFINTVDGKSRNGVARLNADGTLDNSFNPGSGTSGEAGDFNLNGTVWSLALQPDGKIIIAGGFVSVDGVPRNSVARLNTDGTLDASFNPGSPSRCVIRSVALQADGKVLVGGFILLSNGDERPYLARLNANGSTDTSFTASFANLWRVTCIQLQADGKVLVGGQFTRVNGTVRHNLARLNANGSVDTTFDPGNAFFEGGVNSMLLLPDGKILASGYSYSWVDGASWRGILRLNSDGTVDTGFDSAQGASPDAMVLQQDGSLLIGGGFRTVAGVARRHLARLESEGSLDPGFNSNPSGFDAAVNSILVHPDETILLSGNFTFAGSTSRNGIARLNSDGSLDRSFDPGKGATLPGGAAVRAMDLQANGKLVIGGLFNAVDGVSRNSIARLHEDGRHDETFDPGTGATSLTGGLADVNAVAVQPDGRILIGGSFPLVNGTSRPNVARLNSDGSLDFSFDPGTGASRISGFGGNVYSIALQPDGKVLVGGYFELFNGLPRNGLARLHPDGTLDTSFEPQMSSSSVSIRVILLQPDGKIIVNSNRPGLARYHPDGTVDDTFNAASFHTSSLAFQSDGRIIVAGNFQVIDGVVRNGIARLNPDGSLDLSFDPGTGAGGELINSVALQTDGKLVVGGEFSTLNGVARNYIARLHGGDGTDQPGTGVVRLGISRTGIGLALSWGASEGSGFVLEASESLSADAQWFLEANEPALIGDQQVLPINDEGPSRFFRLRKQ